MRYVARPPRIALTIAVALLAVMATAQSALGADGRAYEMVSPVEKYSGIPSFPVYRSSLSEGLVAASSDGDQLVWPSATAFADATNGLFLGYVSKRTATGWETAQQFPDPIDEHPNYLLSNSALLDATDDLFTKITTSSQPHDPLIQPPVRLRSDLWRQDGDSGPAWITRPDSGGASTDPMTRPVYQGRTPNADRIYFRTMEALAPAGVGQVAGALYARTPDGTELVSVDSAGQPIGLCGSILGGAVSTQPQTLGAVSDDGQRVFFTTPAPFGDGDPSCSEPAALYLRDGSTTTKISAPQRPISGPDAAGVKPARFEGAASDGSVVYFTSREALTEGALTGASNRPTLYRYDVASATLTALTPATPGRLLGIVAMSKDGSRFYVVSRDQVVPGQGTVGQPNLYYYDGSAFRFVAQIDITFVGGLTSGWDKAVNDRAAYVRATDDGRRFVFPAARNLTGYDSAGRVELYLFDADAPGSGISCVSCRPDGTPPAGDAQLWAGESGGGVLRNKLPRSIASDGRIFFDSEDSLVEGDTNGVRDVYEWDAGEVRLISTGRSPKPSHFIDSARDGEDVFFITSQALVGWDRDDGLDIYVARRGGGFPEPPAEPVACQGDGCQGSPSGAPRLAGAPTAGVGGRGNAQRGVEARARALAPSRSARSRLARTGRASIAVRASGPGVVSLTVRARTARGMKIVARASKRVAAAGVVRLPVRLSAPARRQLARKRSLALTVAVSLAGGRSQTTRVVLHKKGGRR